MRKAILLIAVGLVGSLAVGGCGGGGDEATLTIWQTYNDQENPVFKDIVAEFEESHPGVTIDVVRLPFAGAEPKIMTALTTNTEPDMARVDVSFLAKLATKNALYDLTPHVPPAFREEILPVALQSCMLNDKLWGLPDQTNGLCLFYNRELFREAGLDPDRPPATWDELIEYGKQLTNKEEGVFGIGVRNSLWWSLPFFYTYGAELLSEDGTRCLLASEEGVAAFQLKVDLYQKHGIEGGAWRAGGIQNDLGFQNGRYAMILNGPWAVKTLEKAGMDFGVGLIPEGPEGTHTNVGGNNLVVFRNAKNPELAAEFLMFVASAETQTMWSDRLGQIPINMGALDTIDAEKHPYLPIFVEQMQTAIARPQTQYYPEIENLMNPEMQAALDGTKSVEAALETAVGEIDKLLAGELE
ncbi:MAG: extracellular solute-binding protein [Candidatus Eisenbacteria bacterium]|nr:extracellular solute-binding protein [Candidatus Eisenbacteria bacterium]